MGRGGQKQVVVGYVEILERDVRHDIVVQIGQRIADAAVRAHARRLLRLGAVAVRIGAVEADRPAIGGPDQIETAALVGFVALACFELILDRSEEHTSELQSLMRISYAVFCLQKKKNTNNT